MDIVKHVKSIVKVAIVSFLVLIVVALLDYGYMFWREYQGYCHKSGAILSAQERLSRALDEHLRQQEVQDLLEVGAVEITDRWASLDEIKQEFTVIPYASRSEFLAANPECCKLTWQTPAGPIDVWKKAALGYGDGWFEFSHKIRYTDRDGVAKEIDATRTYYQVNNCGYTTPKFYH